MERPDPNSQPLPLVEEKEELSSSLSLGTLEEVETIDGSRSSLSWKRLSLTFFLLFLAAAPWYWVSDYMALPPEVALSRQHFQSMRHNFEGEWDHWTQQKTQLLRSMEAPLATLNPLKEPLHFQGVPLEVIQAYLEQELQITQERFPSFAWYPGEDVENPSVILSKEEKHLFPLKVMLSLEVAFVNQGEETHTQLCRLRRGKQEISPSLAWMYFGTELQALRSMTPLFAGVSQLRLSPSPLSQEQKGESALEVAWHYQQQDPFVL